MGYLTSVTHVDWLLDGDSTIVYTQTGHTYIDMVFTHQTYGVYGDIDMYIYIYIDNFWLNMMVDAKQITSMSRLRKYLEMLPSGNDEHFAIEAMAMEMASFPMKSMVI